MAWQQELGQRLRAIRLQRGLTLVQTAERAGMALSAVSNLENGKTSPKLETLLNLAQVFGCTLQDVLPPSLLQPGTLSELDKKLLDLFTLMSLEEKEKLILFLSSVLKNKYYW